MNREMIRVIHLAPEDIGQRLHVTTDGLHRVTAVIHVALRGYGGHSDGKCGGGD